MALQPGGSEVGRLRGVPFMLAEHVCAQPRNAGRMTIVPLVIPGKEVVDNKHSTDFDEPSLRASV
jgi:hypothetical protein